MNLKNLFAVLLCLIAVSAETDYKGKCKDLKEKIEKKREDSIIFTLNNCKLDDKENAVD